MAKEKKKTNQYYFFPVSGRKRVADDKKFFNPNYRRKKNFFDFLNKEHDFSIFETTTAKERKILNEDKRIINKKEEYNFDTHNENEDFENYDTFNFVSLRLI